MCSHLEHFTLGIDYEKDYLVIGHHHYNVYPKISCIYVGRFFAGPNLSQSLEPSSKYIWALSHKIQFLQEPYQVSIARVAHPCSLTTFYI